jgi:hypothetical protein
VQGVTGCGRTGAVCTSGFLMVITYSWQVPAAHPTHGRTATPQLQGVDTTCWCVVRLIATQKSAEKL